MTPCYIRHLPSLVPNLFLVISDNLLPSFYPTSDPPLSQGLPDSLCPQIPPLPGSDPISCHLRSPSSVPISLPVTSDPPLPSFHTISYHLRSPFPQIPLTSCHLKHPSSQFPLHLRPPSSQDPPDSLSPQTLLSLVATHFLPFRHHTS